jgi:hypothetical protein
MKSPQAAEELRAAIQDPEQRESDAYELMGQTDCPQGCLVEPDGTCPHGWESAGLTAGLI